MSTVLTHILDALAANPGSIAAWEIDDLNDPTLSVFDVSKAPTLLVWVSPTQPERKEVSKRLAAADHPTGYYTIATGVVWRNGPAAFEVWSKWSRCLKANADGLFRGDGTALNRADVTAVVPFADRGAAE